METIVYYHKNCSDGFAAALAAWFVLGNEAQYVPADYNDPAPKEDEVAGKNIFILDFSFKEDESRRIFSAAKSVVWIDHHKTSAEYVERLRDEFPSATVIHQMDKSGALLSLEYFRPGIDPGFFAYISDYDLWEFKIPETKAFIKSIWLRQPWSFEDWESIFNSPEMVKRMVHEGDALLKSHELAVKAVVDYAKVRITVPFDGKLLEGLAANCPPSVQSDVGHQLSRMSGTFGLLWNMSSTGANSIKCSLRSTGNYDVSVIAKAFGGGGHRNAAGFHVSMETLLSWMSATTAV